MLWCHENNVFTITPPPILALKCILLLSAPADRIDLSKRLHKPGYFLA
jgi:hypothetical protein